MNKVFEDAQLDDTPSEAIDWMPAHSTKKQLGTVMRRDGKLMADVDRMPNEQADLLAKKGASLHRVSTTEVDAWRQHFAMAKDIATWIGQTAAAASHGHRSQGPILIAPPAGGRDDEDPGRRPAHGP